MNAQHAIKRRQGRVELLCVVGVVLSKKQALLAVEQKQAERGPLRRSLLSHKLSRLFLAEFV
jgi:hypothetical protein